MYGRYMTSPLASGPWGPESSPDCELSASLTQCMNNAPMTGMVEGKGRAGSGLWSAVGLVSSEEKEAERKPHPRWRCGAVLPDLQVVHKHRPRAQGVVP